MKDSILLKLALIIIVSACGILWLQRSQWGESYDFHSDEARFIAGTVNDPAVPFWTIYGRWPIYILRVVAWLTDTSPLSFVLARQISALVAAALAAQRLSGWTGATITVCVCQPVHHTSPNPHIFYHGHVFVHHYK